MLYCVIQHTWIIIRIDLLAPGDNLLADIRVAVIADTATIASSRDIAFVMLIPPFSSCVTHDAQCIRTSCDRRLAGDRSAR